MHSFFKSILCVHMCSTSALGPKEVANMKAKEGLVVYDRGSWLAVEMKVLFAGLVFFLTKFFNMELNTIVGFDLSSTEMFMYQIKLHLVITLDAAIMCFSNFLLVFIHRLPAHLEILLVLTLLTSLSSNQLSIYLPRL